MTSILICRSCGGRARAELATNQQELAGVGMLELKCHRCNTATRWGLAEDYRKAADRRSAERRRGERRTGRAKVQTGGERRGGSDRRHGPVRKAQRRAGRG